MTTRTVRKLSDLHIDEVSLVDRPANQHGVVAIAKRHRGDTMGRFAKADDDSPAVFDSDGVEVFEDELEPGDIVYDDAGTELVYVEEDEGEGEGYEAQDDSEYVDDSELAGVGKGLRRSAELGGLKYAMKGRAAAGQARGAVSNVRTGVEQYRAAGSTGDRARRAAGNAPGRARRVGGRMARQSDVRRGAGVAAGVAGGGGYETGRRRVHKSLGDEVYETLSKALNAENGREEVSKAAQRISGLISKQQGEISQLTELVNSMYEQQELSTFAKLAEGYDLPVDPFELGEVLKAASESLPAEHVQLLDRIFKAAGEAGVYEVLGYEGVDRGGVMDMINAAANEIVGKTDGTTPEQASVALFSANPEAYDQYIEEQRNR